MQLKSLKKKLKEAEKRAITAERTVKTLLKEVDMKEGKDSSRRFYFQLFCKLFLKIILLFLLYIMQKLLLVSDELREEKEKYKAVCDDMDATFAEMTGY